MSLFDDLVQGVSKEVGKIQARSQEMLDTFNMSQQLRDLERRKTTKLLEIGRLVCDKYQRNMDVSEDKFKEKVQEVVGLEEQITLLQGEIDNAKAAHDPDTPASKKAEAKAGYHPTPGFECPRCTAPVNRDKGFCPCCGESLKPEGAATGTEGNGDHS